MANVVPLHKKNYERSIKNYCPVSLLPIFGNIVERLLYNQMYSFFIENDLISLNQSGFRQGDSFFNQVISIAHEIYGSMDQGYEVCGVFLDISKAFNKVWHNDLLHKVKENGINGPLLNVLEDFQSSRLQRVVLNGQHSSWSDVVAGVREGPIVEPILFWIYLNDFSDGLHSNPKLFTDNTSLFLTVHDITDTTNELNNIYEK